MTHFMPSATSQTMPIRMLMTMMVPGLSAVCAPVIRGNAGMNKRTEAFVMRSNFLSPEVTP